MKTQIKGTIATLLVVTALTSTVYATNEVKINELTLESTTTIQKQSTTSSLTDLPATTNWAYEGINFVVSKGLMMGTSTTEFSPSRTMTRAEFITVMVRAMYPDVEQTTTSSAANWWDKYVDRAIEEGLITPIKYTTAQLSDAMPRQEMAWMMMNYIDSVGTGAYSLVNTWQISDYSTIGNQYQSDVLKAYSLGLLAGKDDSGRFDPQGTMTRQEAAAVIMRMVDETKRLEVEVKTPEVSQEAITIYEGQERDGRNAQAGDTFVKADGTQIILTVGPNGVVGEGQGVAPDIGLKTTPGSLVEDQKKCVFYDTGYVDSTGLTINGQVYYVNAVTGEGHWAKEWSQINASGNIPTTDGTFLGELSSDMNWYWADGNWHNAATSNFTESGLNTILTANGLV